MLACPNEPQIQGLAAEPVPLFQLVVGGDRPRVDVVRQIPAFAAERRGTAGRARDRHLPRDGALLVEPLRSDVPR